MIKKTTIAILSLLFVALSGSLLAQPGGFGQRFQHPGPGGPGGPRDGAMRLKMLAVALDLTDDQVAQAEQLFADFHTSNSGSMQQRQELHQRLRESLDAGETDACAIGQTFLQIHQAGETAMAAREGLRSDLHAIMTAEQKEKFDALEEARRSMGGPQGMRHRGPRGFSDRPGRGGK